MDTAADPIAYDPYDVDIAADPYPVFRRLRDEAPLYHHPDLDFHALSRYDDVDAALRDHRTYISSKGGILEIIKAGIDLPPGTLIFEDPPMHTAHRRLLSRAFTPRRVAALEPGIRRFCARCLDPLVGTERFDLIAEVAAVVPMWTIGMLLGIPEELQDAVRVAVDADLRTEAGAPMPVRPGSIASGELFADHVAWRAEHPSDDIVSELLAAELDDGTGPRRLSPQELLTYVHVLAGAGNETTTRLIGWAGKVLAEHPDQRRRLVADPSLVPNAIEELLRYEPPAPHVARVLARPVELHGRTVPEGSAMLLLIGAANRDERRFPEPDRFDVGRDSTGHLTFGVGIHFCLGAALARLEGRVVLEELLRRFPEWDVDLADARLAPTSTVRGWERLPVVVPG